MSVTLDKIVFKDIATTSKDKIWTITSDVATISAYYHNKKGENFVLTLKLKKGFRTDGASVPSVFTWFLPKWDKKNMTYNCAAILHDCLYSNKGMNGKFTREECDDFFRGGVRCAGYSRFKAGVADKCIEWFASSPEHWGSDDLDNVKNKLFTMTTKKLV